MGNICSTDTIESEAKSHIFKVDVQALRNCITKNKTTLDVFKITHQVFDFVTYTFHELGLRARAGTSLLPFLEFYKEQIEKNKSNFEKDKSFSFTRPQLHQQSLGYLETVVECTPYDLKAFTFLLDNAETFPLEKDHEGPLLHRLASKPAAIELLREYLSSGLVDEKFKTNNNKTGSGDDDDNKMRFAAFANETPLEVACRNQNFEAISEFCVAGVGIGTNVNWGRNVEVLLRSLLFVTMSFDQKAHEIECNKVLGTLLSQPGAGPQIREYEVVLDEKLKLEILKQADGRLLSSSSSSAGSSHHPQQHVFQFLGHRTADDLAERLDETMTLATVCFFTQRLMLYNTLVANGCKESKLNSLDGNLFKALQSGNIQDLLPKPVVTKPAGE